MSGHLTSLGRDAQVEASEECLLFLKGVVFISQTVHGVSGKRVNLSDYCKSAAGIATCVWSRYET